MQVTRTSNWLRAAGIAAAAMLLVVSCGGTAAPSGSGASSAVEKTFVLGMDAPLTGGGAAGGQQMKNGLLMAFDKIGNKIGNYNIKIEYIDDKADPGVGAQAMETAIASQGVQAVIGSYNSAVTIAQMDVVARHKIPYFFVGGTAPTIDAKIASNPDLYSYIIGKAYPPSAATQKAYSEALDYYYGKNPSLFCCGKTYATYAEDTDYGRTNAAGVKAGFDTVGWQLKSSDYFNINNTNHVTILEKLKTQNVSFVYVLGTAIPALTGIINQARQVGLKAFMSGGGIQGAPNWYQLVGQNSNGLIDNIQTFTPKGIQWAKDYEAKFGVPATTSGAGTYYDYGTFMISVMQRALDQYREMTSDTLYKVGINDVKAGNVSAKDGVVYPELVYSAETWPYVKVGAQYYAVSLAQYKDGTITNIIWPLANATSTLQPLP